MKKILITFICLLSITLAEAQSNKDIANVYIRRAQEAITESIDFETALGMFQKAMKYTDTILDKNVATLGASVYYETYHRQPTLQKQLDFLEKSKLYSKQYFDLNNGKNKNSEDFLNNTDNYVFILENIETIKKELARLEAERIKKDKEIRRIDSLKTVWKNKSNSLSIKVDSIYGFNKNNVALYKKNGFFGVIDDVGEILFEAKEYKDAVAFDGFIILKDKVDKPTKLYSFNEKTKIGFLISSISEFNTLSTHYGKVMLPRANGKLVTYPNNSHKPFIYDLNARKVVRLNNLKELFKTLKKADVIGKYNKDDEVKIEKEWYNFGGHLGGGIHPLYAIEGYELKAFLCSLDGKVLNTNRGFENIGAFYNNTFQVKNGNVISWINQNGTKVNTVENEASGYDGNSILNKLENGNYQLTKDGIIIPEVLQSYTGFSMID